MKGKTPWLTVADRDLGRAVLRSVLVVAIIVVCVVRLLGVQRADPVEDRSTPFVSWSSSPQPASSAGWSGRTARRW